MALINLAYVQCDLGNWDLGLKHNLAAIEINSRYAVPKYNLAICELKVNSPQKALERLRSIDRDDKDAKRVAEWATKDPELEPLLADPRHGQAARDQLGRLNR